MTRAFIRAPAQQGVGLVDAVPEKLHGLAVRRRDGDGGRARLLKEAAAGGDQRQEGHPHESQTTERGARPAFTAPPSSRAGPIGLAM